MKKTLFILAVLLALLLVVGVVYAERKICDQCKGSGFICTHCLAPVPSSRSRHCNRDNAGIICFICEGKRYVEVNVCE